MSKARSKKVFYPFRSKYNGFGNYWKVTTDLMVNLVAWDFQNNKDSYFVEHQKVQVVVYNSQKIIGGWKF